MREYAQSSQQGLGRQLLAITFAGLILLACRIVESLSIQDSGAGVIRGELFLEPEEKLMVGDVRQAIMEDLKKDPTQKLIVDSPREGGHQFVVERRFKLVSELDGKSGTYRWSTADEGLFTRSYRLEMKLSAIDFGGPRPSSHRLEVSMPGQIVETNGERSGSGRVAFDRLSNSEQNILTAVSKRRHLPGPSNFAEWVVRRLEPRLFDDTTVAFARKGGVWARSLDGGGETKILDLASGANFQASGSTLVLFGGGEEETAEVYRLDAPGSRWQLKGAARHTIQVSPDGRHVAFLRRRPADAEGATGGLFLLDVGSGKEDLIAGVLELPHEAKARAPKSSREQWWGDAFWWSSDSGDLLLTRWYTSQVLVHYTLKLGEKDWKPLPCDGVFGGSAFDGDEYVYSVNTQTRICDLRSGRVSASLDLPMFSGSAAAFSPDGLNLAYPDAGYSKEGASGRLGVSADRAGIWVLNRELKSARRLVAGSPEATTPPRWNQSAAWLLVQISAEQLAPSKVLAVKVASGEAVEVAEDRSALDFHWIRSLRNPAVTPGRVRLAALATYWVLASLLPLLALLILVRLLRAKSARPRLSRESASTTCRSCNARVEVGARFCPKCGSSQVAKEGESETTP